MAIRTKDISPEDSIVEQLAEFIMESETHFAQSSKEAVDRFAPYLQTKTVVDLGCGDGASVPFFNGHGVEVVGVDVNELKLSKNPTKTIHSDIVSYLKKNNHIPNIFCHHALEHLPNPQKVLDLISKKLDGKLYIEVPANDEVHSVHHASFDSPEDLLPKGFKFLERGISQDELYIIAERI